MRAKLEDYFDKALNRRDLDAVDRIIAPSYLEHAPFPGQRLGPEGVKQRIAAFHAAFPDLRFELEDVITASDKAVARWTLTGTNSGSFLGLPANGARIQTSGIDIFRFDNGRIVEHWHEMDILGLVRQITESPQAA